MNGLLTVDPALVHAAAIFGLYMLVPFGYLVFYGTKLNGKKWFLITEAMAAFGILFFFLNGFRLEPLYPPRILYVTYGSFIMLFLYLMVRKHGYKHYEKILGITFILGYVLNEWWEIPVFIAGHIGYLGKEYCGSATQLFLIFAFLTLLRVSHLEITRQNIILMVLPVIASFFIILHFPTVDYSGTVWLVNRFMSYAALGTVFYRGTKIEP